MAESARAFVRKEILPRVEAIEAAQEGLMPELMKKAGEVGLLMLEVPQSYGGIGLGEKISTWISEIIAEGNASFANTLTGHMGIGTLTILYSENEKAKQGYLPCLIRGEKIGCFALTEPEYGSDALSAKTTATLSPDGTYYEITGAKQFTTNAGFGGIFTVFAQVPERGFTAFVVEGSYAGLSTGKEEKKMGLKGGSTCSLILDRVKVPVQNVLGEIGRGHVVALNALNLGRIKVGACCTGAARTLIREALSYAQERKQFGKPIASFGLIQQKLARMAEELFAAESVLYRTAGLVEDAIFGVENGEGYDGRVLQAIGEYAAECAIVKVRASEALGFISDEAVQIFGGYGYIEDYPVARAYRDARVHRIFEGTNEINRLGIVEWLDRLQRKGKLPLETAAEEKLKRIREGKSGAGNEIESPKEIFLALWSLLRERRGEDWQKEQELLAMLADLAIEIYAAESAALRCRKMGEKSAHPVGALAEKLALLCTLRLKEETRGMLPGYVAALADHEGEFALLMTELDRQAPPATVNSIRLEREVASELLKYGSYPFPLFRR